MKGNECQYYMISFLKSMHWYRIYKNCYIEAFLCLNSNLYLSYVFRIRNINFKEYLVAVTLGTCISYLLCIKTCCLVLFTSALQTIQYVKTISKLLFSETLCITKCFVVNINVLRQYVHSQS